MAAMNVGPWSGSPGGAWQDTTRPPLPRLGSPRDLGEADGVASQPLVTGGHRRARRDALQVPVGAAGAATIAEPRNREVADLAGVVVRAAPQPSAEHEAAADAG